jgi:hypothetical protein
MSDAIFPVPETPGNVDHVTKSPLAVADSTPRASKRAVDTKSRYAVSGPSLRNGKVTFDTKASRAVADQSSRVI